MSQRLAPDALKHSSPFFPWLTNAFSRKLRNHRAAVAVFAAVHNFVKIHRSIRMTPAMKAGLTNRIWGNGDLLAA